MNKTNFKSIKNKLIISRTFDASLHLVWKAWTQAEILDKWWAPKPMVSKTKSMQFKEEGTRLYAMVAPNGEEHWAITFYKKINKHNSFTGEHAFCNNNGEINIEFPIGKFNNRFFESSKQTTVIRELTYSSEDHLKRMVDIGMKEGTSMIYENLDKYLKSINNLE